MGFEHEEERVVTPPESWQRRSREPTALLTWRKCTCTGDRDGPGFPVSCSLQWGKADFLYSSIVFMQKTQEWKKHSS